jgi:hypothetical protein
MVSHMQGNAKSFALVKDNTKNYFEEFYKVRLESYVKSRLWSLSLPF